MTVKNIIQNFKENMKSEKKPEDLEENLIIGKKHEIFMFEENEDVKNIILKKKIFCNSKKKATKAKYEWFIKSFENKIEKIEGPFENEKFKEFIDNGLLQNSEIKRKQDLYFIPFIKIEKEHPDFFNSEKLNDIFLYYENKEKRKKNNTELEKKISEMSLKYKQSNNFLKIHNSSLKIKEIILLIKNLTKKEGTEKIKENLKLTKMQSEALIDLIIEESEIQILEDIDKDGFFIKKVSYNK